MAKLSDRQKVNIVNKWKTGQYTKTALAKTYKVSEKTIRDIVGKTPTSNAHIVEAQLKVEEAKNSDKSTNEIAAINQAVEYRLKNKYADDNKRVRIYDLTDKILEEVENILEKKSKTQVVKVKEYFRGKAEGERLELQEVPIDSGDLKNLQDVVDKASITNNTNQRHSNSQINVNTQNNQSNTNINVELTEEQAKEKALELGVPLSALV